MSFGSNQGQSYRSALTSAECQSSSLGGGNLKASHQPRVPQPGTMTNNSSSGSGRGNVRYDPVKDRTNVAFYNLLKSK